MFDPTPYFGTLQRTLASCHAWTLTEGPTLEVELNQHTRHWEIIVWRVEVTFPSGNKLVALESHEKQKGKHYRKVVYCYMKEDGELIFRVDPHQHAVPIEEPPHLHIGPTQDYRLEDGAWELDGYSLRDFDFLKMWALVLNYETDGTVPWR